MQPEIDQKITGARGGPYSLDSHGVLILDSRPSHQSSQPSTANSVKVIAIEKWAREEYQNLQTSWSRYGIAVPSYQDLQKKIRRAYNLMWQITTSRSELHRKMGLLAVPPKNYLEFPVSEKLRSKQRFIEHGDFVAASFPYVESTKTWRLLLTYTALNGLPFAKPFKILEEHLHLIAGYDTRNLGQIEYAALTLQHPYIIDKATSTLLFKDYADGDLIPSARFSRGLYRFLFSHIEANSDEYRYRPTIEIS